MPAKGEAGTHFAEKGAELQQRATCCSTDAMAQSQWFDDAVGSDLPSTG
jgi:hypothetical protein